ncbi:MAG: N-acetylmuramoyl-L-alanine amidase [Bacteroidota bacterium]
MNKILVFITSFIFVLFALTGCINKKSTVKGKVICLDPGHGGTEATDSYRVGPSGEREEWINLRVALHLAKMLEKEGAKVILTRSKDVPVELSVRAKLAIENKADIFISIHHNATADPEVNFPSIYFHANASENLASIQMGKILAKSFRNNFFSTDAPACLISDHVIFPGSGTRVLRDSYGIPGVIGEASFFSNSEEESRLKDEEYNRKEAESYLIAIKEYFSQERKKVLPKYSRIKLSEFNVFQEAERMDSTALLWHDDYLNAKRLAELDNADSLILAEKLLVRSVTSFPDSWIGGEVHIKRSEVLRKLGFDGKADTALLRAKEHYILINN